MIMIAFPSRLSLFRTLASLGPALLMGVLLLPAAAISQTRPAVDEQRTAEIDSPLSHNPLASSEIDSAKRLAKAQPSAIVQTLQPLYVQRHIGDKNADPKTRKADVLYYNYQTNKTIRVVVNLNSNQVEETKVLQGTANQPFFNRAEIETALQLIFDNPHTGPSLRAAYLKITGKNLVDVKTQLMDAQGGVFSHDPNIAMAPVTAACTQDRCMQLFIPIDEASYIDMVNVIVDLSKRQVLWIDAGPAVHLH